MRGIRFNDPRIGAPFHGRVRIASDIGVRALMRGAVKFCRVMNRAATGSRDGVGRDIVAVMAFRAMRMAERLRHCWKAETKGRCCTQYSELNHYFPPIAADTACLVMLNTRQPLAQNGSWIWPERRSSV